MWRCGVVLEYEEQKEIWASIGAALDAQSGEGHHPLAHSHGEERALWRCGVSMSILCMGGGLHWFSGES